MNENEVTIENFAALVGEVDTLRTNTEASLNGYQITTGILNTTLGVGWASYTVTFNEELNNVPVFYSFSVVKGGGAARTFYAPQCVDATKTQAACLIYNTEASPMVVDITVFAMCKA